MKRTKDYTFVEFEIDIDKEIYLVKAKAWFSFETKQAFVTEHLGQSLHTSNRESIEIEMFDIEDISIRGLGSIMDSEYIESLDEKITDKVKEDFTKYFSLNNT